MEICDVKEKITGFTFVTAFRYFPIFFLTRITCTVELGNKELFGRPKIVP